MTAYSWIFWMYKTYEEINIDWLIMFALRRHSTKRLYRGDYDNQYNIIISVSCNIWIGLYHQQKNQYTVVFILVSRLYTFNQ